MNSKKNSQTNSGSLPATWIWYSILLVLCLPLLAVFAFGFLDASTGSITGFSLSGYEEFVKPYRLRELGSVLTRSIICGSIASLFAFGLSYLLVRFYSLGFQNLFLLLITLPFLINESVKTFAWTILLAENGLLNWMLSPFTKEGWFTLASNWNVWIIIIINLLPFGIFISILTLRNIDKNIWLAAEEFGAKSWALFVRIAFPLAKYGFFLSIVVTSFFALSMTSEVTFLGGDTKQSIAILVADLFSARKVSAVFSLGTVFVIIISIFYFFIYYGSSKMNKST